MYASKIYRFEMIILLAALRVTGRRIEVCKVLVLPVTYVLADIASKPFDYDNVPAQEWKGG
jgi:hypothetical protein